MIRRTLFILALACFAAATVHATPGGLNRSFSGEGVSINVTSPYSDLPPGGCVPFLVKIDNDLGGPGTWRIFFRGTNNYALSGGTYYEQKVTVPAHTSSVFDIMVPLPFADEHSNTFLNFGIQGPGFNAGAANFGYVYSTAGTLMPFAAYSENVLGKAGTGPLESLHKGPSGRGGSTTFYGTEVVPGDLPLDWRGYSGLARLFLTDGDWTDLAAARKQAILDWIAQGGRLSIVTTDVSDQHMATLQLPSPKGMSGPYGFGDIAVDLVNSLPAEAEFLSTATHHDPAMTAQNVDAGFSSWSLRDGVGTIVLHGGFILCFVFAFGILVGPVNLFVFARGAKRFRLFWTTPLISIAASLALIAGILLTDGLGGHGKRLTAILSMPGSNREVVIQEQIARTAVLFTNLWHGDEGYYVSPISDKLLDGTIRTRNAYYHSVRSEPTTDGYNKIGNDYTGHWFRSRSMTGQYLQVVRPSRSSLTVTNPDELASGPGHAPVILSSYPQTLSQIFFLDNNGGYWSAENVEPGHKTTLNSSTGQDFSSFWAVATKSAGGKLAPLVHSTVRPGYFYAVADASPGQVLPTLNEINWKDDPTIYLGPWVSVPAPATPEKTP